MAIIALTTDFGASSPYVAAMKGVILGIDPHATIVDLTHSVAAQDVAHGAVVLADYSGCFPAETIHVAVVDPGVGTDRRILFVRHGSLRFVAPDNGLLTLVLAGEEPDQAIVLEDRSYWRPRVSNTFHGRDVMAPVAAHLSRGVDPERLGRPTDTLRRLDFAPLVVDADSIVGHVVAVDSFGNLLTDITGSMLSAVGDGSRATIRCGSEVVRGLVATYGHRPRGTVVALVGSSDRLEIAVVGGSAASRLDVGPGAEIAVER